MDIRKVKKLIELLEESGLAELELHEGEESVRIMRYSSAPSVTAPAVAVTSPPAQAAPLLSSSAATETDEDLPPTGHVVTSPMVGTYYASSTPGEAPFVDVGQSVRQGDTLCIIEAMKILNHIEADVSGVVEAVLAENSQPVEYGQPLFVIK